MLYVKFQFSDNVIVCGGALTLAKYTTDCHTYDPIKNTW